MVLKVIIEVQRVRVYFFSLLSMQWFVKNFYLVNVLEMWISLNELFNLLLLFHFSKLYLKKVFKLIL